MTVLSSVLAPKVTPLPLSQVRRHISLYFYCWCAIGGQQRDKEPANLKAAKILAEKIETNVQSSGKSNIPGYTRGNSSHNKETKGKGVELEEKGTSKYPMKEMAEMMKSLVTNQNQQMANHAAQLNHMQNILVMMERNNGLRKF